MHRFRFSFTSTFAVILSLLASVVTLQPIAAQPAAAPPAAKASAIKEAGLVFAVGGLGDKSYNDLSWAGLQRAGKEFGIQVEYREPGQPSQRDIIMQQFARGDKDLIIGVGFMFTDTITGLAEDFGKKKFACVDYVDSGDMPENLAAINFREQEGAFLVGMIAALKSKTGKVGFVGGVESPLIKKFQAGYTQGAKYARPDVEVRAAYAGVSDTAFADPQKGKELGLSMINAGVDVIFHASGSTGLGVFRAAEERKVMAIGVDKDQSAEAAPGVIITSMIKKVDEAIYDVCKRAAQGNFKGGMHLYGLKENALGYVYDPKIISEEIHKKVEDAKARIISGEIKVKSTI